MIVILKPNPNEDQLESLKSWLLGKGIQIHMSIGTSHMILGLVGDTSTLDIDLISALDIVEDVKRVQEPYKNANRKFHPEDTVIPVGNTQIGGGTLTVMAGPCSVESPEQIIAVAKAVMWNSKLVILDEPTAALGVAQTRQVLDLVKRLGEQGLGVVLVSHTLHDIFEVADRITVLRLGHSVAVFDAKDVTQTQVVEAITAGTLSTVPGQQEGAKA